MAGVDVLKETMGRIAVTVIKHKGLLLFSHHLISPFYVSL